MPASIDGGQDIDIELEKMLFEFSPGLLTTATNVVTAFTSLQKVCAFVCVCVFFSNFWYKSSQNLVGWSRRLLKETHPVRTPKGLRCRYHKQGDFTEQNF